MLIPDAVASGDIGEILVGYFWDGGILVGNASTVTGKKDQNYFVEIYFQFINLHDEKSMIVGFNDDSDVNDGDLSEGGGWS